MLGDRIWIVTVLSCRELPESDLEEFQRGDWILMTGEPNQDRSMLRIHAGPERCLGCG